VVRAGAWAFGFRLGDRGLGFVRTIILAHLLAPADFGVFGLTVLALSALDTLSQTGFDEALIQTREDPGVYLNTVWTVHIVRGAVVALVLAIAAPWLASFFNEPAATGIFRLVGLSVFLNGLTNPGVVLFRRDLDFRRQAFLLAGGSVTELVVAVGIALVVPSAWALAFGMIARSIGRATLSYRIHPFRPRLAFDFARFHELYRFGRVVLLQGIVIFLVTQGDDAFVGKLLGAAALAFYQMAYRFSNLAATEIAQVVGSVTFPALASLQHDRARLGGALLRSIELTTLVSLPLSAATLVLAPDFTMAVLGPKWMPIVPAMQVLAVFGALRSIGASVGPAYLATARLGTHLAFGLVQLAFMVVTIYPLSMRWGIQGTSVSVTAALLVAVVMSVWTVRGIAAIPTGRLLAALGRGTAVAAGIVVGVLAFRRLLGPMSAWMSFVVLGFVSMAIAAGLTVLIQRLWGGVATELFSVVRERRAPRREGGK
jgi:O-antigen/teichoic acid export membrane protein